MAVVDQECKERVGGAGEDIAVAYSDVERDVWGIENKAINVRIGSGAARPGGGSGDRNHCSVRNVLAHLGLPCDHDDVACRQAVDGDACGVEGDGSGVGRGDSEGDIVSRAVAHVNKCKCDWHSVACVKRLKSRDVAHYGVGTAGADNRHWGKSGAVLLRRSGQFVTAHGQGGRDGEDGDTRVVGIGRGYKAVGNGIGECHIGVRGGGDGECGSTPDNN